MPDLSLTFMGQFQAGLDGQRLQGFDSNKVRALLVYLAVETRVHSRSDLAALLWPGYSAESARTNFRQALHQLRDTLGDAGAVPPFLLITRQTLQFNPAAAVTLDVATFTALRAECVRHAHPRLETCTDCLARLRQAAELYQGDFLAGFAMDDSGGFEEWRRVQQEHLYIQMIEGLETLMRAGEAVNDHEAVRRYALRHLSLEPWHEPAHRQVMAALARQGQRAAALAQYHTCRQVLLEELRAEPDATTTALYEQIRSGTFPNKETTRQAGPEGAPETELTNLTPSPPHPLTPSPCLDWAEMPVIDHFQGRATELAQLEQWLTADACRLVAVLGMGGAGKTALTAKVVRQVADGFAFVIWRSLLNAPSLAEVLRGWLQLLSRQHLTTLPDSFDEQVRLLLEHLRRERCLLVLDNGESILQAGDAGEIRPGYEGYAQLLERLGAGDHRSCLLLTSREQPQAMTRLLGQAGGNSGRVRTLHLPGLDAAAGEAILQRQGLTLVPTEAQTLVEHYSGNPLALQIVANTIVDLFDGDVAAFQGAGLPIFDNIRAVLDEQIARLSDLERELLIWLAIEREAVSVATLRSDLVQPPPMHLVLAALRALQRRSLLEKASDGFTLQNVVIEYVTERLIEDVCAELRDTVTGAMEREVALSAPHPVALSLLQRHALLKAQAKEYVRQSQVRLILQPLAERLRAHMGQARLLEKLPQLLDGLRGTVPGYAAGNLLNLLVHQGLDVGRYDFSRLSVWQADLRGARFAGLDLSGADLTHSAFTLVFDLVAVTLGEAGEVWMAGATAGEVCLWQAGGGQLQDTLRLPSNGAYPLVFSPSADGRPRLLAGSGLDHTVWLLSMETGRYLHTLHGHSDKVWALAFSADERLLATGSLDHTIRLWDLASGQSTLTLYGHSGGISALVFSPDGARLASSSGDQTIRVWDVHTGRMLQVLHEHPGEIYCLAISPDGALLASGGRDCTIRLWDLRSYRYLGALPGHTHSINALRFQPHSATHLLASASTDQTVRLWNVATSQIVHTLLGHAFDVITLAFSPSGDRLVSGSSDQTLMLWETATGRALDTIKGYPVIIYAVGCSPDGTLVASGGADGLVRLWGVAGADHVATVLDRASAPYSQVIQHLPGHTGPIYAFAFSPTEMPGPRLLACAGADHIISLHEVTNGRTIRTLPGHKAAVNALAFSPDGQWLASASSDRTIRLWPMAVPTGQAARVLYGHEDEVATLAFTPDGQTLVSGSMDYTVRLWAVNSGQALGVLRGHDAGVTCVAVSPDGQQIVSSSFDRTLRFWDAHTGQILQVRSSNGIGNPTVAFSPDGDLLAYSVEEVAIEVWSNRTQQVLHTLRDHTSAIKALAFSPAAPLLVSGGWDGRICLWDLESGACLHTLPPEGPYVGMKITGVTGISAAQKAALKALGAEE